MTQQQKNYLMMLVRRDTASDTIEKQKRISTIDTEIKRINTFIDLNQARLETLEVSKTRLQEEIQNLLDIEIALEASVVL